MATSEFGCRGPFLFIGASHDGEYHSCSQDIVVIPVRRDAQVGEYERSVDFECEEYRISRVQIEGGGAIHFVYVMTGLDPDTAFQTLTKAYRGK